MRIDFTVTDDDGNELAWGGTSPQPTLKDLAFELGSMVENGEFPHADRLNRPADEGGEDRG